MNLKTGLVAHFDPRVGGVNAGAGFVARVFDEYLESLLGNLEYRILDRSEDGIIRFRKGDPRVMLDSRGGAFSPDFLFRRSSVRAVSTSLLSLWDLGLYERQRTLLKLLDHSLQ